MDVDYASTTSPSYQSQISHTTTIGQNYRRLSYRPDVLPPQCTPVNIQISILSQRWLLWAEGISCEDRRTRIMTWIEHKKRNAFIEIYKKSTIGDRHITSQKCTKAKIIKPTKLPVLVSTCHKNSIRFAVMASELEAANIQMDQIDRRVLENQVDFDLLERFTRRLGRDIRQYDWYGTEQPTAENRLGRDLFVYTLYEVQEIKKDLAYLERLYNGFRVQSQKRNTLNRIKKAKEVQQQFIALATELEEKRPALIAKLDLNTESIDEDQESYEIVSQDIAKDTADNNRSKRIEGSSENEESENGRNVCHHAEEKHKIEQKEKHNLIEDDLVMEQPPLKKSKLAQDPIDDVISNGDQNRSLILKLKTCPGFDPKNFSASIVNEFKGFHYRFVKSSSLCQRQNIEEKLVQYIKDRIRSGKYSKMGSRFGREEVLTDEADPERPAIVRGFWETSKHSRPKKSTWFFEGKDEPEELLSKLILTFKRDGESWRVKRNLIKKSKPQKSNGDLELDEDDSDEDWKP